MSCILFYSPFDLRSRDTESLMIAFKRQGFRVISLSQEKGRVIHPYLESQGIETQTYVIPTEKNIFYFLRHIFYLIKFCWRNKVDVVYSHLEAPGFVASVAQYFIKSKVFICRHHIDEAALYGFDRSLTYRITYRLAKKIIVVSKHAMSYMVNYEKIPAHKIIHINLAYDFSLYKKPDQKMVDEIRQLYSCDILLVTACRLTKYKRPDVAIASVMKMLHAGLDVKLIILGKGEDEDVLRKLISENRLTDKVIMPGYVANMPDYLAAADFLLHPSLLESSCVVVKEAGLVKTPVIVCKGVGDFDDYIIQNENGFLVDRDLYASESAKLIQEYQKDKNHFKYTGEMLYTSVIRLFGIDNVIDQYKKLNNA